MDASQAFDRVHYVKLFKLLLKRGLCFVSACFLLSLYTRQKLRLKWEHTLSCEFFVKNGVKQGGVLSPLFFAMYIDELLLQLQASGFGSYIGHYFVGALAYADDVTLLGPTLTSINLMLNVVKTFGARYDVIFNASKTKLTKFGNRNDISKEFVEFNDNCIRCENSACHLGNNIGFNMERDHLSKSINEFVSNITRIEASFSYADADVLYKLLKSYCMPLYGCVLWDFSKKAVSWFFITWRKSARYLLNLPYKTNSRLLSRIVGDKAIEVQLHCRFVKYLVSLRESDNVLLKLGFKLCLSGSCSNTCNSYVYIKERYNMKSDHEKVLNSDEFIPSITDDFLVCHIKDLLCMRESPQNSILSSDEIRSLLEYLCCYTNSTINM